MQEMKTTIHGSRSMVLGFGRVGMTLGRTLKAMGAEVAVVSDNEEKWPGPMKWGAKESRYVISRITLIE